MENKENKPDFYHVYPSYYLQFSCLKGECRHSCCIGWEIDIDGRSLQRYDAMEGELGDRIRKAIDREETPHFRLTEGERCPFLTKDGLCELILQCGEDVLCHICKSHPRFYNFAGKYMEIGLGMACESAARLILLSKEPMTLVIKEAPKRTYKPRFASLKKRGEMIALLQDRTKSIDERILACKKLIGARTVIDARKWIGVFLALEQLTEEWTSLLQKLEESADSVDTEAFDRHMQSRETEYEQLLVYLTYRYIEARMSNDTIVDLFLVIELLYRMYRLLAAMQFSQTGSFTEEDAVSLIRMMSAEIEYSVENMCELWDRVSLEEIFAKDTVDFIDSDIFD